MMFTEQDAQNDGKIVEEAGMEMKKVAARTSPELYSLFEEYCDRIGRRPHIVLGEAALRAINDEVYREQLLNTDVDVSKLQVTDIREEDLRLVKRMSEEFGFGIDGDSDSKSTVDKLIEERLEAVGGGMFTGMSRRNKQKDKKLEREIQKTKEEIGEIKKMISESNGGERTEDEQDVDSLFDDSGGDEEEGEVDGGDEGGNKIDADTIEVKGSEESGGNLPGTEEAEENE